MKRRGVIFLLIVALSVVGLQLSAQDDDEDKRDPALQAAIDAINFRPIDDIVDAELIVTNFANDGTATLPIETSVPVACTIVYGTTPQFGTLTLDQDMAGGTHSSHNPLLEGLLPETTYYLRVQGVDDFGNVYISDTMTFTTPPQDETQTTNLLSPELGAEVIGVSSNFGGAANDERWGILSAFDGSLNTAWATNGDGDDAWFEVKLAGRYHIDRLEFQSRLMGDGSSQIFEFTVTTDDGEVYGPYEVGEEQDLVEFDVDFEAETLRFDVIKSSGGNTGADEIAVYGTPAG
jgi:hypothetical protein